MNQIDKYLENVKMNGMALEFIKEQTDEICLEAVKQNGLALQYVKKQTPEICLEAVKNNASTLRYVQQQTNEMCLEAVKQNGYALQYVKEQTEEICIKAVNINISTIIYIQDANILKNVCNTLNILYLPANNNHRELILNFFNGEYRCWIGCQGNMSLDTLIWRIYNTNGGLEENPHRQHYIDFLKKHNLYNVA